MPSPATTQTDVILPMRNYDMQQIIQRTKTYEFRRYKLNSSVQRVWFYLNAPHSHIAYICEIDPARTRNHGDERLPEDGLGNSEFNARHKDWEGFDYAYRIRSVRKLREPIGLQCMMKVYGMACAPRGRVYVPENIFAAVRWSDQDVVWSVSDNAESTEHGPSGKMPNNH